VGPITEDIAEFVDRCGQILFEIDKDIVLPQRFAELLARDDLARVVDQELKDRERLRLYL
jgi:hypothetical protein